MTDSHWPRSIQAILVLSTLVTLLFVVPLFWLLGPHDGLARELHRLPEAISWDIDSNPQEIGFGPPAVHFWTRASHEQVSAALGAEFDRLLYERSTEPSSDPLSDGEQWARSDVTVTIYRTTDPSPAQGGLQCGKTVIAFYPGEASCWLIRFHASD